MIENKGRFAIEVILFVVILFMIYTLATSDKAGDIAGDEAVTAAADQIEDIDVDAIKRDAAALTASQPARSAPANNRRPDNTGVPPGSRPETQPQSADDYMDDFRGLNN